MPGSLVENRPPESRVLPSQRPGQDSSDSHRAATSTNKCLFSTHQCTPVKEEKPTQEWLEGMACQLMLHILPLYFFPSWGLGGVFGEKGSLFVFWLLVTGHCVRVLFCITIFVRNFLGCMMITRSSVSPGLFWSLEGKIQNHQHIRMP